MGERRSEGTGDGLRCPRPIEREAGSDPRDRKSTRLNSSHTVISYAVFCLKKNTDNSHTQPSSLSLLSHSTVFLSFLTVWRSRLSTLFPYTTLFRSAEVEKASM